MATKNCIKNNFTRGVIAITAAVLFFCAQEASAAILQVNSDSGIISPGNTATLYISVNSEGVSINNAEARISYSPDVIDVLSVSKGSSIFSLWVEEPAFSNYAGTITFSGGLPNPGFSGVNGPIMTAVVRAKKAGRAEFAITSAAVRANDGMGTDILRLRQGKTIVIAETEKPKIEKPKTETETEITSAAIPALTISSVTHPSQDMWYQNKSATFKWNVPAGVAAVQTSIGRNASGIPYIKYAPPIAEKTVTDLADDVWYFKVRAGDGSGWGPINSYTVKIDSAPPQLKEAGFIYDIDSGFLNVSADVADTTSGIEHYEIYVNGSLLQTVPADKFIDGKYSFEFSGTGENSVKLAVFDRAGNRAESIGTFRAADMPVLELDPVPPTVNGGEQAIISGNSRASEFSVDINIKREDGTVTSLKAKPNRYGTFFALTPKFEPGNYDIWAETLRNGAVVASAHAQIRALPVPPPAGSGFVPAQPQESASRSLVAIGSISIAAFSLVVSILALLIFLFAAIYYLWHHYHRFKHRIKVRTILATNDNSATLVLLKKRLEKHLAILQRIRHNRMWTKEEKQIKEAIESDLDEVDRAMENQSKQ